mgnify:CR=1 FL=1
MPEMVVDKPQTDVNLVAPKQRFELPPEEGEQPKATEPAAAPPSENTGEQAPPAKPEGEKPDTEKDDPEKRGTRRFERRIQKAYQKMAEEKARADFLEKQLAEAKPKAVVDSTSPTLEQFGFDPEKYAEAKAAHEADKKLKEYQSKQREESQKQTFERASTDWEVKVSKAEDKYEDFEEKVGKLDPRNPVVLSIMEADTGADIAYYLGTHTDEAKKIFSLSAASAIREIGKLEARLSSTPEKPKAPSKAPAPIAALTGTSPVATSTPSEEDDTATWIKKRQRQVHGKR